MPALRQYGRILAALGMTTALHTDGPEPYLACWMPECQSPRPWSGPVELTIHEWTHVEERRALALSGLLLAVS